ncbi:MAG: SIR2 family protein [Elusimicrobiaceae bacterium]
MEDNDFAIDPIIPLAYNMADGCARYALFIGAGVSKDAGIPSGMDILLGTLKLIKQMEDKSGAPISDAEIREYYKKKFANSTYSDIIASVFPSNEEQRGYLQNIFAGISPGKAHRLIADFVRRGFIKFIITTNFDRLLEQALDEVGLNGKYTVISEDEAKFSKPWNQEKFCRIYKIHGTIEKGKIRNTKKDLSALPRDLCADIRDIVERHGLIVLGYAANEDDESVSAILKNRRFSGYSLYWAAWQGKLSENAREMLARQNGISINIESAGDFLADLYARIEIARSNSEQTKSAVYQTRFKNMFLSPASDIEILHAIDDERQKIIRRIDSRLDSASDSYPELWTVFTELFSFCSNYLLLSEQIIRYSPKDFKHITKIFEQISKAQRKGGFGRSGVRQYLCFCLMEVIAATAIEHGKFSLLAEILKTKRLNFTLDAMEYILNWEVQPEFIHYRAKETDGNAKPLTAMFEYLLELVARQDFPLEFDIKSRLLEADLMFLAYSIKYPLKSSSLYWFARSPVYCGKGSPELFKRIKFDTEFADLVAAEFFGEDRGELFKILARAKSVIQTEFSQWYQHSRAAEKTLEEF